MKNHLITLLPAIALSLFSAGNAQADGAGDPIGYTKVNAIKNIHGKTATAVYARIRH